MPNLYRKSVIDRLSSPEQLDRMIVIASPQLWLAAAGAALIVAAALIWSIVGRLPSKVDANGIFVSDQGVSSLYADASGIVSEVAVAEGDSVRAGQTILRLSGKDTEKDLTELAQRIATVEAVTLTSTDDTSNADTQQLLNLKTQYAANTDSASQQQATLDRYRAELAALTPQIDAAKAELDAARESYYNAIGKTIDQDAELDYSKAQTVYNSKLSIYESDNNQTNAARNDYQQALEAYKAAWEQQADPKPENYEEVLQLFNQKLGAIQNASACSPVGLPADCAAALQTLYDTYARYAALLNTAKAELDAAKSDYDKAADKYQDYADDKASLSADQSTLGNTYQEKNTAYNTLLNQQQSLQSQILSLQTQLTAAGMTDSTQAKSLSEQFETAKAATLSSLNDQLQQLQNELQKNETNAETDGKVLQLFVSEGSVVQQGAEIARIRPETDSRDIIICYVPVSSGKSITPGMKVVVYPTTVNKQEYGHMEATVLSVDDYVTNSGTMKEQLGDESLVQAFTANGPVVGVKCLLRTDETTASGYYWSSQKGRSLTLTQGTMVTADIVTEEKAPITLLIPLLKEKLSVKPLDSASGGAQ